MYNLENTSYEMGFSFKDKQAGAELGQAQPELGLEDRVLCCGLNFEAEA